MENPQGLQAPCVLQLAQSSVLQLAQCQFAGWAVVEIPELPEREYSVEGYTYVGARYAPTGSVVRRPAVPARTVLLSPAAIFRLTPCTEEVAREALESIQRVPLTLVSLAEETEVETPF